MKETPKTHMYNTNHGSTGPGCPSEKQKEYSDRHRFWSDKSIQQLSFSNNLLLTISIAAFGYFFGKREQIYEELIIDTSLPVDWTATFFVLGSILLWLSILGGTLLTVTRLYDFRLSRHILLTRKRACKAGWPLNDWDCQTPALTTAFCDVFRVFFSYGNLAITRQECRTNDETFSTKFKELRKISLSLGKATWFLFNS